MSLPDPILLKRRQTQRVTVVRMKMMQRGFIATENKMFNLAAEGGLLRLHTHVEIFLIECAARDFHLGLQIELEPLRHVGVVDRFALEFRRGFVGLGSPDVLRGVICYAGSASAQPHHDWDKSEIS
jgi:hypothetical protein